MASTEPTTPINRARTAEYRQNVGDHALVKGRMVTRDRPLDWITARPTSSYTAPLEQEGHQCPGQAQQHPSTMKGQRMKELVAPHIFIMAISSRR